MTDAKEDPKPEPKQAPKQEVKPELSPGELWAALTMTPRPWETVDFPRKDPVTGKPVGQLAIWVLTQEEQIVSAAAAEKQAKQLLKEQQRSGDQNIGYEHVYANEATVQVLYRACRDVRDIERPAFPSPGEMRKKLTVDEIGTLMHLYIEVQTKLGPIIARLDKEDEELLIRRLADGGAYFPTASLSPEYRNHLLISMASQLVGYWTATSSPGSQPDAPTTSESVKTVDEDNIVPPDVDAIPEGD